MSAYSIGQTIKNEAEVLVQMASNMEDEISELKRINSQLEDKVSELEHEVGRLSNQ